VPSPDIQLMVMPQAILFQSIRLVGDDGLGVYVSLVANEEGAV